MFIQDANKPKPQYNSEIPPPNYMVWAILSTIFCCMPLGIVSIIKASEVNSKWMIGDKTGAKSASEQAKKWAVISAVVHITLGAIILFFYFVILLGTISA
ncbi:CD225/dispanin family protein [Weeksellaceae bacterium TAE3-ERU29]|nr:CD225/dispanin family protein [Weeksellaceae bacterium TAE3-ERU29]